MKDLLIQEISFTEFHLVERLEDGSEEIIYEGTSRQECLFQQLKYAEVASVAKEERQERGEKFADHHILHITNRITHD